MSEKLIVPEFLQQSARDELSALGNLGELWVGPQLPHAIQDGEHLVWEWNELDTVIYTRFNQGKGSYARIPRLELTNIHLPRYGDITKGEPETVGSPTYEVITSQSVDLFPEDSTKLSLTDTFTDTVSELEATKLAIQNSAKIRFGATATPAGAEFTSQITNELTKQSTTTTTHTSTVGTEVTVVNKESKPFKVRLEANRTITKVRYSAVIDCELDYTITWVPFQRPATVVGATWGSVAQFWSSMAGKEPSSVGYFPGPNPRSISDKARSNPQSRPPRRIIKLPYTVEFDHAVVSDVHQVREPI